MRQDAWERSADAYLAFRNTFAATLAGAVKRDVFYARARGYQSSLDAALAGDDIPRGVFHNLLDTVWIQAEASDRGLTTSPSQIDDQVKQVKTQSFRSPSEYKQFLKDALAAGAVDVLACSARLAPTRGA